MSFSCYNSSYVLSAAQIPAIMTKILRIFTSLLCLVLQVKSGSSPLRSLVNCPFPCLTCNNSGECLTCITNSHISGSTCVCDDGLWMGQTGCELCPVICQTCSDYNTCLSCKENASFTGSICVCSDKFFWSPPQCQACHETCLHCANSAASGCTTCSPTASLKGDGTCVCISNHFWDAVGKLCQSCDNTCATCKDTTVSGCLTCKDNMNMSSGQCICKQSFYWNEQAKQCLACDVSCATCSTDGKCATCPTNSERNAGNTCTCLLGFFAQASSCLACEKSCRTCSGSASGSCLTCVNPLILQGIAPNKCSCNDGTFLSSQTNICEACHPACKTCAGATVMSCQSCMDNAAVQSGKCTCNVGYFMNENECLACPSACTMCVSAIKCTVCAEHAKLTATQTCDCIGNSNWDAKTMKCNCANGYYFDNISQACITCIENCVKCTGPLNSDCQTCVGELTPSSSGCSCASGMMQSGNCVACHPSCTRCTGQTANECLTCKEGLRLDKRTCICPSGYFDINTSKCEKCGLGCGTCSDGAVTSCLTCYGPLTMNGKAPAECVCLDESAGCCDDTCKGQGRLPLCKKDCSPPDSPIEDWKLKVIIAVSCVAGFLLLVIIAFIVFRIARRFFRTPGGEKESSSRV